MIQHAHFQAYIQQKGVHVFNHVCKNTQCSAIQKSQKQPRSPTTVEHIS